MWAKTSRFGIIGLVGALLLAGCGGSSQGTCNIASACGSKVSSTTNGHSAEYPSQYKEAYFRGNKCGTEDGDSTSSCECQIKYIEAHLPYKDLEEGSSEHAKSEEVLNQAASQCFGEHASEHTPAEEAAHNSAVEGEQKYQELKEQKERELQPEEERVEKIKEKVEYEDGG